VNLCVQPGVWAELAGNVGQRTRLGLDNGSGRNIQRLVDDLRWISLLVAAANIALVALHNVVVILEVIYLLVEECVEHRADLNVSGNVVGYAGWVRRLQWGCKLGVHVKGRSSAM
jgi:hypothetical protein